MRTLIVLLFLFSLLLPLGCESVEEPSEEPTEENIAVIVNGVEVTEEELEKYMGDARVYKAGEGLSGKEIRETAIEMAIKTIIEDQYFEEKGITASEEEIEEELNSLVSDYPDVQSNFTRRHIERMLIYRIMVRKLAKTMAESIEITEEEALQYYKEWRKEIGEDLPPFEEMKDIIEKHLAENQAGVMIYDELEKRREEADVQIME